MMAEINMMFYRVFTLMEEIRTKYTQTVNVIFLNIVKHKNQVLMKYFGVAAIPTQVLLDKDGIEFFRHTGYYSVEELENKFALPKT